MLTWEALTINKRQLLNRRLSQPVGKFKVSIYTEDFGRGGVGKHINLEVSHPVTSQSRDGKIGIGKRIPKQFDKTTTKQPGKRWQRVSKI